ASQLTDLLGKAYLALKDLGTKLTKAVDEADVITSAFICKDEVIPTMAALRGFVDKAETLVSKEYWSIPTYGELLFDVR
ncbi:MAG: glutamine synthetase type III, partial [Ruminiclostridium sp.]|nr:glutamine synthetase type III [Ruminiclostridium sp.]